MAKLSEMVPESLRDDLIALIKYVWDDEETDYLINDEGDSGHIFPAIARLNEALTGHVYQGLREGDK